MHIKITNETSSLAGFISWKRLAEEMFLGASELRNNEHITHFEVSERGINYFVSTTGAKCSGSTSVSKTDRAGSIPAASASLTIPEYDGGGAA